MIHAAKLVSVGLWHETEDGFQVNDYLDYNPAGEKVRAERSAAKERMSRHRSPEPEKCSAEQTAKFFFPVPVPIRSPGAAFGGGGSPAKDSFAGSAAFRGIISVRL